MALAREERKARRRALQGLGVPEFKDFLRAQPGQECEGAGSSAGEGLAVRRRRAEVLQLNIGLYCNQACSHCHVESSPQVDRRWTAGRPQVDRR